MNNQQLTDRYKAVKAACHQGWQSNAAADAILALALDSLRFLASECEPIELVSRVPGKQYCSFKRNAVISRPANRSLMLLDVQQVSAGWEEWHQGGLPPANADSIFYTIALAPCLAMEMFNRSNKKGPATYFEHLVGHIFSTLLQLEPRKGAALPVANRQVLLTMDFLFQTPGDAANLHLPVKMSTRERIVQAWAHQKMLESVPDSGPFRGVMVIFSETKLDLRKLEVVEICVPDQWLAYQSLLATMDRIYYMDVPVRYQELAASFPSLINISRFSDCLTETTPFAADR